MNKIAEALTTMVKKVNPSFTDENISKLVESVEKAINEEKAVAIEEAKAKWVAESTEKKDEKVEKVDEAKKDKKDDDKKSDDKEDKKEDDKEDKDEKKEDKKEKSSDDVAAAIKEFDDKATAALDEIIVELDKKYTGLADELKANVEDSMEKFEVNESLVSKISSYLDAFIEEKIPEQKMIDHIKLERLEKFYDTVRGNVFVFNEDIQNAKEATLKEIDAKVTKISTELNEALEARVQMKNELNKSKVMNLLYERTRTLDERIAKKIVGQFKDLEYDTVNKRLDESIKLLTEKVDDDREILNERSSKLDNVSKQEELIMESKRPDIMESYIGSLNKFRM